MKAAGYSATSLPKKLGIKPGMAVALLSAPAGFRATLGDLPSGVVLRAGMRQTAGLVIWFVRAEGDLAPGIGRIADFAGDSHLWIAWRKKAARGPAAPADSPSEQSVRSAGLAAGLVDFKVCAIDDTWSGLLFARRRPGRDDVG